MTPSGLPNLSFALNGIHFPADTCPVEAGLTRGSRRVVAISIGAALVTVFLSLALVYTSAGSTRRVADNARQLHWVNATLGSANMVRAANAQAVFFAVDHAIGVASDESRMRAADEAAAALNALRVLAESPELPEDSALDLTNEGLDQLILSSQQVIDLIQSGEANRALDVNRIEVESSYRALSSRLAGLRDQIQERISSSESSAGRLALATQVLVTLLIPLIALVIYRVIVTRQLREHRMQSETKLQAARELNKAKDEFIAGLSHEFRTPLTSIYGFSEVLLDSGLIDPSSSMELIGLINSESSELSRMVDDLLVAARLEADALSIKATEVNIGEELDTVLAPWLRTGHNIEVKAPSLTVLADPLRLRQILRNLISNAVRHGGPKVAVWGRADRGELVCSVVDDGVGVPDEIAGRLFDRFVHEGREALLAGSVGLGLNIARSLVLAMGGDLVYERIQNTTWFTFRLPLANRASASAVSSAALSVDRLTR
jgi:signal transduction histidine kinase